MRPFSNTRGIRGCPSPMSSEATWAAARFSACCSRRSALNNSPRMGPSGSANKRTDGIVVVILCAIDILLYLEERNFIRIGRIGNLVQNGTSFELAETGQASYLQLKEKARMTRLEEIAPSGGAFLPSLGCLRPGLFGDSMPVGILRYSSRFSGDCSQGRSDGPCNIQKKA